ncbi:histidinol-phosphate transaminase [Peloplasma aerotolerans]|uniref:Histidinol-phosphate aminotransferase n=1 Tax=Peloplasma aerotolerans TaxID=3044389 RepID=A0AAW6UDA2_9MOLU|nr:histidinol-phosphate transaminase [Mariniplasma sp. M4Ah]MDI6453624.1 histidinol-phosphate transaminase [Mariniplasma sp. M4Ah]MDR4968379.1 histidinol-phosphate transaminase [Acholeplasmataceae bacterium]
MKVKNVVKDLKPYQPNDIPYTIKLDANESENYLFPQGIMMNEIEVNRYPDSSAFELRKSIQEFIKVDHKLIIAGNGSSEMIELILKTFIEPKDRILSFEPSFSMYSIFSKIYFADYVAVSSEPDFSLDMIKMIGLAKKLNPKVIFICSPNNPTGFKFDHSEIIELVQNTKSLIVLDEAYIEFSSDQDSLVSYVESFDNLIVLRTLSKAFGLAGARLGYLVSNQDIIHALNTVKSPYNLNSITQFIGIQALKQVDKMIKFTNQIKQEKSVLDQKLSSLGLQTYSSEANFIFFKCEVIDLFKKLVERKILIRSFGGLLVGYYRVTVGTRAQNEMLIANLKEIIDEKSDC